LFCKRELFHWFSIGFPSGTWQQPKKKNQINNQKERRERRRARERERKEREREREKKAKRKRRRRGKSPAKNP